jgi:aspartate aminotransferase
VCFQPGDEVLIPAPYWVTFPEQVRLSGATPVFLPTEAHAFQIEPAELARAITARTRGILINTPHNPTGVVYGAHVLEGIARLAIRHDLLCIFDECYEALVYQPAEHANVVKLVPAMKQRTILVGSFSKTYCMAGWRAGFLAAPRPVVKAIANLQSHTASNACSLVQYAALAAMDARNDAFVAQVRERLRGQRATALEVLAMVPGVSCVAPGGAFYLFPDVSALLGKSWNGTRVTNVDVLAEMLLEHAHVAVVPGTAFGSSKHLRISYAVPSEEITEGLTNFGGFARSLG